jgi:transposase
VSERRGTFASPLVHAAAMTTHTFSHDTRGPVYQGMKGKTLREFPERRGPRRYVARNGPYSFFTLRDCEETARQLPSLCLTKWSVHS